MKLLKSGVETKLIAIAGFRVGDFDFADFYDTKMTDHFRITHYQDYAPHVMHRMQGYRHTNQEMYMPADGLSMRQCAPV
jgi:hypothetical protein